jgi:hypothetical protein
MIYDPTNPWALGPIGSTPLLFDLSVYVARTKRRESGPNTTNLERLAFEVYRRDFLPCGRFVGPNIASL